MLPKDFELLKTLLTPQAYKQMWLMFVCGWLSLMSGAAQYLYYVINKGVPVDWKMFFANCCIAFVIGTIVGAFVVPGKEYMFGIAVLCGVFHREIIEVSKARANKLLNKAVDKVENRLE